MHNHFLSEISAVLSEIKETLQPWVARERQAQEIALEVQKSVRQLNNLPTTLPDTAPDDLISVLKSTCVLLERLLAHPEFLSTEPITSTKPVSTVPADPNSEDNLNLSPSSPSPQNVQSTHVAVAPLLPPPAMEPEPELSVTAQELIKLRDWVLMAKGANSTPSTRMLENLYQQLGHILAKEGVIALEETGIFNYERQQVISTEKTDDPEKKDLVCDTVRPGYLFHSKLIRSQEVIIYTANQPKNLGEDAT